MTVGSDTEPHVLAGAIARHISSTLGPVESWTAVVRCGDGRQVVLYPPGQDPTAAYQLHLDAAHALSCSGCANCRRD